MAEVKIKIATEIGESLNALNKETRSVKTLGDTLVHTKKNTEEFTAAQNAFFKAVNRDLQKAFDASNGGLKGYEAELKVLEKYETNLRLGVGKTSATYQKYSAVINHLKGEIGKIKKENLEAQKAQDAHNQSVRNFAEYLQRVEQQAASIRALNNQNADIGFMMLTGDELGVANYTLKQYEASLKETIAATGVNSQATQKAYAEYAQKKQIVDELAQSQERYASVQKTTAEETSTSTKAFREMEEATGKTGLKILSVAKNILKFQLLMGPITASVRGIKTFFSDSVKLAAEAEQRFAKLATVFDGFGESAKNMARNLASSIGVANSTAASALSTVGDLLQAQGMGTGESLTTAADWVKQFQDIIAFKDINMTLEEFAQNFMSGAAGNLRNFRTFGSIVKESAVNAELAAKGLDKLTGSELELAKMTTRAELALSQQKNAIGATEREWETMLSVNRRLDEAQKQLKENIGDSLNGVLKDLKQRWTDILNDINDAIARQQEFNKESRNVATQKSIHQSPNNIEPFIKDALGVEFAGLLNRNDVYQGKGGEWYYQKLGGAEEKLGGFGKALQQLVNIMAYYDASIEDLQKYVKGLELSETALKALTELEAERRRQVEADARALEKLTSLSSSYDSYSSFMESISAITGVGKLNTLDLSEEALKRASRGDVSSNAVAKMISQGGFSGIEEAMAQLASADLKSFGDLISGELGDLNDGDLLKNKAESYKQFFEAIHNYFGKDGDYSADELAVLENIKKAYASTNEEAKKYQERLEAEAGIKGHIGNAQDVLWEATTRQRFTEEGKPSDQMSIWIKYEKELQELDKLFKTLGKDTIEINGETITQAKAIDLVKEARQAEIDAMKKEEQELGKLEKFFKGLSDAGATNFASALQGSSLYHFYDAYNKASTSENGLLGETGAEAGITAILLEILAQTEVFQEILDMFSPIIQIMNAFLKPLEPILESISEIVSAIFTSIMKPLFEPFKIMAAGVLLISKTVETIAKAVGGTVSNAGTFIHNVGYWLGGWMFGMERQSYYDYSDIAPIWNNIDQELESIRNATLDIKENTDKDNSELLKAYTQMRDNGMITGTEWEALVKELDGVSYDRMRTYGGNAWQNGKGGTTVIYYGDLKFTIDGTNLSAEEIAEAVTRKQKEWAGNGQYA